MTRPHSSLPSVLLRALFGALLLAGPATLAQGVTTSALTGTVSDPTGAVVSDAAVQLRNSGTGALFNGVTDARGIYVLDNIPPGGPYSLTVQGGVFEPVSIDGILLRLGNRQKLDVRLHTVMGEAIDIIVNNDQLDDKRRTGPSTRVNETTITKLPLQGRTFSDLQNTDPRVSGGSFAGQNNRYNNIQIDGGANNDLFGLAGNGLPGGQAGATAISLEAIKEFNIQLAPFDVRLGNFAGGIVNAVTKSGTNEFHGSVYGYLQSKSFANPNKYQSINGTYDNYTDAGFQDYTTLQYGATLGGPIVKDKAHFFLSLDMQTKQQSYGNTISGDPGSDKSTWGFTQADAQRFQNDLAKYGINAGDAFAPSVKNPSRNLFAKVTTSVIDNSQLEISYNYVNAQSDVLSRSLGLSLTSPSGGYQLSNAGYAFANTTNTARLKLTSNWDGGKLSNELLAGVSIIRDARAIPNNVPLILVGGFSVGASSVALAAGGERFSQANTLDQDIYQLQDNLTWTLGSHRLTFGTSNEFFTFKNLFLQAATGVWVFNTLSDFEAGNAAVYQRRFGASPLQDAGVARFGVMQLGAYVQDDWSPFANFTVTPGFRVDMPIPQTAKTNPTLLSAALPIDTGTIPQYQPLWSPRLGFNWDVEGNSNTVVRGGVGLFSGRPPYVWLSNAYSINGLSQVTLTCNSKTGVPKFTPDAGAQPYSCNGSTSVSAPTNNGEIDYFDKNTKYPQNLRVAFGVDRRLPWDVVLSADFLYTHDVNGWYYTDENLKVTGSNGEGRTTYGTFAAAPGTNGLIAATTSKIDPNLLTNAIKVSNESDGYVTSLTFQASKQFAGGFGINVGYTYARSYDTMSLTSSQAFSNYQFVPLDGTVQNRNVRPSNFDRPNRLVVTATYQLPYDIGVALSYAGQSGLPYTWTVNGDVNGDGVNGNDLVYVPRTSNDISLAPGTYTDKTAAYQALDSFISSQDCLNSARGGFAQRGACRNPWQDYLDMRFTWTTPKIGGTEQRIELQWDIFNVLNLLNPQWGHLNFIGGNTSSFETASVQFLKAVGYDTANNRPIYQFVQPNSLVTTRYDATSSRWRMQFGAKYAF
jgi:Carboxypeptidase regulatory-like domain